MCQSVIFLFVNLSVVFLISVFFSSSVFVINVTYSVKHKESDIVFFFIKDTHFKVLFG